MRAVTRSLGVMFLVAGRVTRSAAFVAQPRRGFRAVADWGPNAGGGVRTAPSLPWSSPPALLSTATPQEEITPAVVSTKVATEEEEIRLPTNEDSEELLKIRHTTAHVMAMAVQELFPQVQVTIGPWIDNGFYYDFFTPEGPFTEADLKQIKKRMVRARPPPPPSPPTHPPTRCPRRGPHRGPLQDKIMKKKLPLVREEVTKEEARARIEAINEPYKLEILESIIERDPEAPITLYHVGDEWWDLCAGPHVEHTGQISPKAVDLQSVAGAYWRGDETKSMLTRIYGTAWETAAQLKAYKKALVEVRGSGRIAGISIRST